MAGNLTRAVPFSRSTWTGQQRSVLARDWAERPSDRPYNDCMTHFADRLADAVRRKGTALCVGLDPRRESLPVSLRDHDPATAYEAFCVRVLEIIAPIVGVVKPQSAFFEACGPAGLAALQTVLRRAKELGLVTILDAKRGDIASTATAYAEAAFTALDADALTVN